MSEYWIKTIFAALLLGAGLTAFLSMMARLGRPGDEARLERLRKLHKRTGYTFIVLLAPLVWLGADILSKTGDSLSTRGTFHFVLAMTLLAVLLVKVLIVKTYRQLLRYANSLGIALFSLTLVIFLITAGYYILISLAG